MIVKPSVQPAELSANAELLEELTTCGGRPRPLARMSVYPIACVWRAFRILFTLRCDVLNYGLCPDASWVAEFEQERT